MLKREMNKAFAKLYRGNASQLMTKQEAVNFYAHTIAERVNCSNSEAKEYVSSKFAGFTKFEDTCPGKPAA